MCSIDYRNTDFEFAEKVNVYKKTCSCGCVTVLPPVTKNNKDYKVCRWCGKKLYKDEEKQKAADKATAREDFRTKMWSVMRGTC